MDSIDYHAIRVSPEGEPAPSNRSTVNWYLPLFVTIVTLFAVYWGFVRPTSRQLSKMRRYVTSLEQSIADLNGQRPGVKVATSLLDDLTLQDEATIEAQAALREMRSLHQQIVHESQQIRSARQSLGQLVSLRNDVAQQVSLIEATHRALDAVNGVHDRIQQAAIDSEESTLALEKVDQMRANLTVASHKLQSASPLIDEVDMLTDRLSDNRAVMSALETVDQVHHGLTLATRKLKSASPALDEVDYLTERLNETANRAVAAQEVADQLIAIENDLLGRGSYTASAHVALDDLIGLRDRVEAQSLTVEKANTTLARMQQLHERVMDQEEIVYSAIEMLELSTDVQTQIRQTYDTLTEVRRMFTDVVMLQPTLQQVAHSLKPITELGNLRRLSVYELRQVANLIGQRHLALAEEAADLDEPVEVVADADVMTSTN